MILSFETLKKIITGKKRSPDSLSPQFYPKKTFFKFQIEMRKDYFFFCLIFNFFFISTASFSQTINFDETWKEFLENNKISNMSELVRPDKQYNKPEYAKYLLMNTKRLFLLFLCNLCRSRYRNNA